MLNGRQRSSAAVAQPWVPWGIPSAERESASQQFQQLLAPGQLELGQAVIAAHLHTHERVAPQDAQRVLRLCNFSGKGVYSREDFTVVMYLVHMLQDGGLVPSTLPEELVPPGRRAPQTDATPTKGNGHAQAKAAAPNPWEANFEASPAPGGFEANFEDADATPRSSPWAAGESATPKTAPPPAPANFVASFPPEPTMPAPSHDPWASPKMAAKKSPRSRRRPPASHQGQPARPAPQLLPRHSKAVVKPPAAAAGAALDESNPFAVGPPLPAKSKAKPAAAAADGMPPGPEDMLNNPFALPPPPPAAREPTRSKRMQERETVLAQAKREQQIELARWFSTMQDLQAEERNAIHALEGIRHTALHNLTLLERQYNAERDTLGQLQRTRAALDQELQSKVAHMSDSSEREMARLRVEQNTLQSNLRELQTALQGVHRDLDLRNEELQACTLQLRLLKGQEEAAQAALTAAVETAHTRGLTVDARDTPEVILTTATPAGSFISSPADTPVPTPAVTPSNTPGTVRKAMPAAPAINLPPRMFRSFFFFFFFF